MDNSQGVAPLCRFPKSALQRPRSRTLSNPAGTCEAECATQTAVTQGCALSHRPMRFTTPKVFEKRPPGEAQSDITHFHDGFSTGAAPFGQLRGKVLFDGIRWAAGLFIINNRYIYALIPKSVHNAQEHHSMGDIKPRHGRKESEPLRIFRSARAKSTLRISPFERLRKFCGRSRANSRASTTSENRTRYAFRSERRFTPTSYGLISKTELNERKSRTRSPSSQ